MVSFPTGSRLTLHQINTAPDQHCTRLTLHQINTAPNQHRLSPTVCVPQLAIVCEELERAATAMDSTSLDAAAFFVSDCLGRARMANNRMPSRSGSWG
jgi:hypothetical protein